MVMLTRPDPNPSDLRQPANREYVEQLQTDPLSDWPVARAAYMLTGLEKVIVRYDCVASQGRISFGRSVEYTDGVCIYLAPDVADAHEHMDIVGVDEFWSGADLQIDPGVTWGRIEWDDVGDVADALAYLHWQMALDDGNADTQSLVDPSVALLCHAAAERGRDVQIRRGVMSEGRDYWDANPGEPGVGLFVPDLVMARRDGTAAPSEAHIKSAYGYAPPPPNMARRHQVSTDPEKLDDHRWRRY